MKAVLNCLDTQSGATFAAVVHKRADDYALAVVHESLKLTGRSRITVLSDHENSVKKLANVVREVVPPEDRAAQHTRGLQCLRRRHSTLQLRVGEAAPDAEVEIRGGVQAAVDSGAQGAACHRSCVTVPGRSRISR